MLLTKLGSWGRAVDSPATVLTPLSSSLHQQHPRVSSSRTLQPNLCTASVETYRVASPAKPFWSSQTTKRNILALHQLPPTLSFAYCTCCLLLITELRSITWLVYNSDRAWSRCSSQAAAPGEKHHHHLCSLVIHDRDAFRVNCSIN